MALQLWRLLGKEAKKTFAPVSLTAPFFHVVELKLLFRLWYHDALWL
jgi:hypothetical protein